MEPPVRVCKAISDIDPNARLGFDGKFWCLIKLYRSRDLETKFLAEPDFWKNRGPIFSKIGRARPDWDLLARVPCSVSTFSSSAVETGDCVDQFKSWTLDIRDTIRADLIRQSKEYEEMLTDHAEEMTDYAQWHVRHGVKIGEIGPSKIEARKFRDKNSEAKIHGDVERFNKYDAERINLEYAWRTQGWVPKEERQGD